MKWNRLVAVAATSAALTLGATLVAQNPGVDVNRHIHPNLNAAQHLIEQAIGRVSNGQRSNEFDMDGHAAKAKALLEQADEEIKLAAQASNHNKR
jgi:hypothetical protein